MGFYWRVAGKPLSLAWRCVGGEYYNIIKVAARVPWSTAVVVRLLIERGANVDSLEEPYRSRCRNMMDLPSASRAGSIDQDSKTSTAWKLMQECPTLLVIPTSGWSD